MAHYKKSKRPFYLHLLFIVWIILFSIFINCATYCISRDSLKEQMQSAVPMEGTFTFTTGGFFLFRKIMSNNIRTLVVTDKNGKEKTINVSIRTGIRITTKDGKRKTFYFDTMFLENNCVVGQNTHFFNWPIKPISFEEITKIELQ
jgi:hypothetical protein